MSELAKAEKLIPTYISKPSLTYLLCIIPIYPLPRHRDSSTESPLSSNIAR